LKRSTSFYAGLFGLLLLPGSVMAVAASKKSASPTLDRRRPPRGVKITPKKLDFGIVPVGERGKQVFNIENFTDDFVLFQLEEPAEPFVFAEDTPRKFALIPGDYILVEVQYVSTDEGRHSSTIFVNSNFKGRPIQTVELKGRGGPTSFANVELDPPFADYGTTSPDQGVPRFITVKNTGKESRDVVLEVDGFPTFHIGGDGQDKKREKVTLAGGQSVDILVGFHPHRTGRYRGALNCKVLDVVDSRPRKLAPVLLYGRCAD
jgi:hypothetical protein